MKPRCQKLIEPSKKLNDKFKKLRELNGLNGLCKELNKYNQKNLNFLDFIIGLGSGIAITSIAIISITSLLMILIAYFMLLIILLLFLMSIVFLLMKSIGTLSIISLKSLFIMDDMQRIFLVMFRSVQLHRLKRYLFFPEETIAELIALKRRRQKQNLPQWKINLELTIEVLLLLWAIHIEIRLQNLSLPPSKKRNID